MQIYGNTPLMRPILDSQGLSRCTMTFGFLTSELITPGVKVRQLKEVDHVR